jgi:hypothetical protein
VVKGNPTISEVKSVMKILPDGRLHNKSFYLKNGAWEEGHEATYAEKRPVIESQN